MKLTITHINNMLEKGQLECIDYEIVGAYVHGKYKITEKGFNTLSKKMLNHITNESKNNS